MKTDKDCKKTELIRCEDLTLGYGSRILFEHLSFSIYKGDYFCIVGENGSGKTTLMNAIIGNKSPEKGKIVLRDSIKENGIGYLAQQKSQQKDFPASVFEVVISGCRRKRGFRPFFNDDEKRIACQNMERLGILNLKKHCFSELSGGQQQRVLIARTLSATDEVIMLDEPVTGLDSQITGDLYKILKELNDEGVTVIMISHDLDAANKYSNRLLELGKGDFRCKSL